MNHVADPIDTGASLRSSTRSSNESQPHILLCMDDLIRQVVIEEKDDLISSTAVKSSQEAGDLQSDETEENTSSVNEVSLCGNSLIETKPRILSINVTLNRDQSEQCRQDETEMDKATSDTSD